MAQHRIMTILLFVCLSLCFEVAQSELKKDGDPCINSDDCESRCCHRDSPNGSGKCVLKSSPGVRCYGPNNGNPCFHSHQCNSRCCIPGTSVYNAFCVPKYDKTRKCLGPNIEDFCYSSDQCHSRCCDNENTEGNFPVCITKSGNAKCFGADNGDYCALNTLCKSGCCQGIWRYRTYKSGICKRKAAENEQCDLEPVGGLYKYCPCESGLVCEMDTSINTTHKMKMLYKELKKTLSEDTIKVLLNDPNRRICKKPNTGNK
ncbi:leucine-rich colipase-like protein 1 isoform X2 [Eleutherodactylus coqui]|uniref:leucine-rich colipase-like protein 1 isoform X2 n=1 Tax=Eleutherodactylus coqui TaxID=57060 RepID=UPI0034623A09